MCLGLPEYPTPTRIAPQCQALVTQCFEKKRPNMVKTSANLNANARRHTSSARSKVDLSGNTENDQLRSRDQTLDPLLQSNPVGSVNQPVLFTKMENASLSEGNCAQYC